MHPYQVQADRLSRAMAGQEGDLVTARRPVYVFNLVCARDEDLAQRLPAIRRGHVERAVEEAFILAALLDDDALRPPRDICLRVRPAHCRPLLGLLDHRALFAALDEHGFGI